MYITNEYVKDGVTLTTSIDLSVEELKEMGLNILEVLKALPRESYASGGPVKVNVRLGGETAIREAVAAEIAKGGTTQNRAFEGRYNTSSPR